MSGAAWRSNGGPVSPADVRAAWRPGPFRIAVTVYAAGGRYGFVFRSRARRESVARKNALTAALADAARRFPNSRETEAQIVTVEF